MLEALLEYQFMQNAFWASLMASVMCGLVGVMVMEKKMLMLSGGIAHTAYGGIGMGYYLGFEPIWGAFFFAVPAALVIGRIRRDSAARSDILIGLFWSIGMALGIMFVAFTPGYPPDITSYLFGNILAVLRQDLLFTFYLMLFVVFAIASFFNYWKAYLFDEQFASIRGVRVLILENLLYLLIALTVVVLIKVVGIILVLALLTAPPFIAAALTDDLFKRMGLAILLGFIFCCGGLWFSYNHNLSSGAVIVLLAGLASLLLAAGKTIFNQLYRNIAE